LHLKGAFLTAYAVQESENYNYTNDSLLSNENREEDILEEKLNMNDEVKNEDILATVEELSQDLSDAAAATTTDEASDVVDTSVATEEASLEEAAPSGVVGALQKVLNDTVVFYYAAQRAHWNVEGDDFAQYHELFAGIYEDALGSLDGIAENMRKLQAFPATLTESVMNASFKDDSDLTEAMGLASTLLEKNNSLNASVMVAFAEANAANEQGIANFLAERDDMHKKWAWQLRASLKEEGMEPAKESWNINKESEVVTESEEEQTSAVDSSETAAPEEIEKTEESATDLTGTTKADEQASEQDVNDAASKLQSLEEENQKLKNALHRTLVERVVDAKIANGLESYEAREELIADHSKRTASSLADSLRDLATMPVAKTKHVNMPEINPEIAVENEENVIFSDKQEEEVEETKVTTVEQLFVDAFMGRRKL